MAEFQNTIDLLGDEAVTKALVERTITEFNDDVITTVGRNAFYQHAALTSVNMPNVTNVGQYAFYSCKKLETADFQKVTNVGDYAFTNNSALTSVNMPNVTVAGNSAFSSSAIKAINLPKLEVVMQYSFSQCGSLESARLDSARSVINFGFKRCSKLSSIYCPKLVDLRQDAFYGCTSLKILDLSFAEKSSGYFNSTCFENSALETLIIRRAMVPSLDTVEAFAGTPFASGKAGGTLLVPRSLTESYQTATNWSVIIAWNANNRVLALEDYTVDGTITGEIDWDKLGGTT